MFSNIGPGELLIIVIVLIFLFGGKKLPDLARGLGESSKELKKVKAEINHAISDLNSDDEADVSSSEETAKGGETKSA